MINKILILSNCRIIKFLIFPIFLLQQEIKVFIIVIYPNGQIVSIWSTQIWCTLLPQSVQVTKGSNSK